TSSWAVHSRSRAMASATAGPIPAPEQRRAAPRRFLRRRCRRKQQRVSRQYREARIRADLRLAYRRIELGSIAERYRQRTLTSSYNGVTASSTAAAPSRAASIPPRAAPAMKVLGLLSSQ